VKLKKRDIERGKTAQRFYNPEEIIEVNGAPKLRGEVPKYYSEKI